MSYSEPLINQVRVFLLSVGMGVPLCLVYIVVQGLFRSISSKRWSVFSCDAVFCMISTFVSFFFMVFYNNGRVRLHLIFGEALGFFVFYRTLGRYLLSAVLKTADLIHLSASFVLYPVRRVGLSFVNGISEWGISLKEFYLSKKEIKKKKEINGDSDEENLL